MKWPSCRRDGPAEPLPEPGLSGLPGLLLTPVRQPFGYCSGDRSRDAGHRSRDAGDRGALSGLLEQTHSSSVLTCRDGREDQVAGDTGLVDELRAGPLERAEEGRRPGVLPTDQGHRVVRLQGGRDLVDVLGVQEATG